jgi:hypothetical protein
MNLRAPLIAVIAAVLLALAVAMPFAPAGLRREAWSDTRTGSLPADDHVDREISSTSLERLKHQVNTPLPRLRSSGYLQER